MTAISDRILAENAAVLDRMLNHPFVTGLIDGTLPEAAYDRYLVYEGAFVETAISIFALATVKAPDLPAKRWLIGVQQALATEQMGYFEDSYAARAIDTAVAQPEAVTDFHSGMLRIAQDGGFLDIVTAMFAAEWMYFTWCSRAAGASIADAHRRRWVDLHADADFARQARWLRNRLDRHAQPRDLPRLNALFARVTTLEIAFHDAPLTAATGAADA